jgi:hypothetical protein
MFATGKSDAAARAQRVRLASSVRGTSRGERPSFAHLTIPVAVCTRKVHGCMLVENFGSY